VGRAGTSRPRGIVDQSAIDAAIAKSVFAPLPPETLRDLMRGARQLPLAAKEYFVHQGELPRCGMIVKGFVRMGRVHADGRALTVGWEYPGCIFGALGVLHPPAPLDIQAVIDTTFLELAVPVFRERVMTDPKVAYAITGLAIAFLRRTIDEIVMFALGDLRTRVEWRILELACRNPPGTPLLAEITQDELAQAVAAARPSVARILKTLRDEGSIKSMYGGILVLKPQALAPPPHRHQVA
jgi:CRP/FNR family cyclic AMP-dependent transcriptional regulator